MLRCVFGWFSSWNRTNQIFPRFSDRLLSLIFSTILGSYKLLFEIDVGFKSHNFIIVFLWLVVHILG